MDVRVARRFVCISHTLLPCHLASCACISRGTGHVWAVGVSCRVGNLQWRASKLVARPDCVVAAAA
ncbi:hypothetical protein BCR44DRAFT_1443758 [Catenaria anguillulae PL171]|uniref:Secreted protein n=1 Tax=Catenaria anguillulae PL171 TaxID=765915 RepID=A0A1Y2H8E2_9FUNG|nr:hypothetical protein BCR44DRAFT_1443758 [Catenaria anguillulae PL171]